MNAKELLDKYIKYNSKITFDIFKLMYQKLIDLGFISPHTVENAFKEFSDDCPYFVMKLYNNKPFFNQYPSNLIEQSEISVEDILGYNPFESFILPEQWCIKVQEMKNTPEEIVNWRLKIVMCGTWTSPGYLNNHGYHSTKINPDYTELTLEQFKQYVLKEPVKTEIMETEKDWSKATKEELLEEAKRRYPVGCIFKCLVTGCDYVMKEDVEFKYEVKGIYSYIDNSLYHKHYENNQWAKIVSLPESKVESIIEYAECTEALYGLKVGQIYEVRDKRIGIYDYPATGQFRPSTKEAFEAQNKPKLIEKWSVGSYAVALKDKINWSNTQKGDIYEITNIGIATNLTKSYNGLSFSTPKLDTEFKWFATLTKAEEFAKTLVKSVECKECKCTNESSVDKPKQLLKQAVHCKTQEEWDFVNLKMKFTAKFEISSCVRYLDDGCISSIEYFKERHLDNYQLLSFQEWCDLNGYKMKKIICKKGDCYVVTKECPGRYGTLNFCYQALVDHTDAIYFETNSCISTQNTSVRPATLEEIAEYKRVGKPYDVTTLQPSINTYGLNIGDKLDSIIIAAWEKKGFNYFSGSSEEWKVGNGLAYDNNRNIEGFKIINGILGFSVSGTLGIYLKAEGFKEFADNYYAENTSNFKVGSWYKYNGYYLKYSKTDDRNIFIASEYINTEDNSFKDDLIDFTCGIADGSKKLVTNLSVIQQFLPEGHPDLFNTLNKKVEYIFETFKIRVTSREVKRINI